MSSRWLGLPLAFGLWILAPSFMVCQQPAKPVDPANVVRARRLLQAMHLGESLLAGIESSVTQQRHQNNQLPPVFYDSLVARMKRSIPEVLDSLAPTYASRFGSTELEEMIHFFESPTGQHLTNQQASLGDDAKAFGQRWGMRLAASVMKDLADAGIDLNKP